MQNFETVIGTAANFDLKKLLLIKIKAILMEFWKDLVIFRESKKPSGKFLCGWAKIQLGFEIFEKTLKFTCKNLNGKLIFSPFFPSSRIFHYLHIWTIPKFFGVAWGWFISPGLGGYFRICGGCEGSGGVV